MAGEPELLEVVGTSHAIGSLAHLLDRWQQQRDQHGDDSNDHEQLNERESALT